MGTGAIAEPSNVMDVVVATLSQMDKQCFVRTAGTAEVKRRFGELGRRLGFKVACDKAHYPGADDQAWLYDLTWWRACRSESPAGGNEPYMSSIPMVLEAELSRGSKNGDDIDPDFQKLVQARADIRVWISTSPHDACQHIANCKEQIRLFDQSRVGDQYVFAVYDWNKQEPLIETFVVSPEGVSDQG